MDADKPETGGKLSSIGEFPLPSYFYTHRAARFRLYAGVPRRGDKTVRWTSIPSKKASYRSGGDVWGRWMMSRLKVCQVPHFKASPTAPQSALRNKRRGCQPPCESIVAGKPPGCLRRRARFDLWWPDRRQQDLDTIKDLLVPAPQGVRVPL